MNDANDMNDTIDEELLELGPDPTEHNKKATSSSEIRNKIPDGAKTQKIWLADGKTKTLLKAPKTTWIQSLIYLDGKPISFEGRSYLYPIYNIDHRKKILMTGRQVEKSSLLACEIISTMVVVPYTKAVYISPSYLQTRQFSNAKLKPWSEDSPLVKRHFISTQTSNQVFERSFNNGSFCFLRSAFLNADRARGLSATILYLDEAQDLLSSNVPVIEECLSHCEDPREVISGTPKTMDGNLQTMFETSSMCEWLVPCEHHIPQHWNYLDERTVGRNGPVCNKCGKFIDPSKGRWVAFNSEKEIAGYRLPQIIVPWIYRLPNKWQELVWKKDHYSKGQFYNECLGISYDNASKPITRADLVACCSDQHPVRGKPDIWTRRVQIFAGVDWGEGSDGTERGEKGKIKPASYTALTLGVYITPKIFHCFYFRRFTGKEAHPNFCVDEIIRVLREFNITCAGVDWGHGWGVNEKLQEALGYQRVVKFQHVGNMKERKKFDDVGVKYLLSRTEVMTDFFISVKKNEIVFPPWESCKDYLCDVEHVFADYMTGTNTLRYDHRVTEPDDFCHSMIYCREAADNYFHIAR